MSKVLDFCAAGRRLESSLAPGGPIVARYLFVLREDCSSILRHRDARDCRTCRFEVCVIPRPSHDHSRIGWSRLFPPLRCLMCSLSWV